MFDELRDKIISIFTSRLTVLTIVFFVLGGILTYRCFNLQIVHGEEYLEDFVLQTEKTRDITTSAIAISKEDATAPIRVLNNVAKEAEALEFKGAVVEGTLYDIDGIKSLASIPSREELISKLLGSLQSPITNLARVLNQIAEKGDGAAEA